MRLSAEQLAEIEKAGGKVSRGLQKREKPVVSDESKAIRSLQSVAEKIGQESVAITGAVSDIVNATVADKTATRDSFERVLNRMMERRPIPYRAKVVRYDNDKTKGIDYVDFYPLVDE